ncbi:hypothetical protein PVAP13_8NG212700 [Panicum virgatum]|uniref:Uncharacterized protein n=1 Tax=Panicum virgatum TaxID=38727 RepID=A0A8T0PDS1_PANVG|nr:hypothetical protein PVAP13_8NG212700 [Panicum virgatum]
MASDPWERALREMREEKAKGMAVNTWLLPPSPPPPKPPTMQRQIFFHHGYPTITTTVTCEAEVAEQFIREIRGDGVFGMLVGLDTEWRQRRDDSYKIALLQLCVGSRCLIFSGSPGWWATSRCSEEVPRRGR